MARRKRQRHHARTSVARQKGDTVRVRFGRAKQTDLELKNIDRVRLENELRHILNLKQDQVLIVDLGSNEDAARSSAAVLGAQPPQQDDGMVVI